MTEDDCGTQQRRRDEGAGRRRRSDRGAARAHPRPRRRPPTSSIRRRRTTLFDAGTLLGEDEVEQIEALGIDEVKVRTPLTCDTRYGLCATCYGRDLGRGTWSTSAKRSASSPRSRSASRARSSRCARSTSAARHRVPRRQSQVEAKSAGTVRFSPLMRYVTNAKGELVVIARSGEVMIHDDNGRERERHKVPYGATLQVEGRRQVQGGQGARARGTRPRVRSSPSTPARVKFENVEEGVTVAKQIDEVTGLSTLVVIDPKRRGTARRQGRAPAGEAARRRAARKSSSPAPTCR